MASPVLFISPHGDDALRLRRMLSPIPVAFDDVRDCQQARAKLEQQRYSVILTEAGLPDGSWLDVMALARAMAPGAEVIVTDRHADARFWAEALNLGAYDLLAQPFYEIEVRRIHSNACSRVGHMRAA
jgi:two-component system response regulator PilR (NtrC family)